MILARCAVCAREDLSVAQEVAQLAKEEGMEEEESEDAPPDVSAISPSSPVLPPPAPFWMGGTSYMISPQRLVNTLLDEGKPLVLDQTLITRKPAFGTESSLTVLPRPPRTTPFRMLFVFSKLARGVILLQRCVDPHRSTPER